MREPSPQALRDRFAYMFRYGYGEFYFARGWLQILFSASQKIDAVLGDDKRGFHWIQLAEKLGAKGFDFHLDRASATLWLSQYAPSRTGQQWHRRPPAWSAVPLLNADSTRIIS